MSDDSISPASIQNRVTAPSDLEEDLASAVAEYLNCSIETARAVAKALVMTDMELRKWLDEAKIEALEDTP